MKAIVSNSSRLDVIPALEANMEAAFSLLARHAQGGELVENPYLLRYTTGVQHPMANGVFRTRFSRAGAANRVREVLRYFKTLELPMMWFVTPSTKPHDLGDVLIANGLKRRSSSPAMAASLLTLPPMPKLPADVVIQEVDSVEMQATWSRIMSEGSQLPHEVGGLFENLPEVVGFGEGATLRNFLAFEGGVPVASSTLLLDSGVAGIYCVSTLMEARRQGLGTAMTITPLLVARSLGYKVGVLQASSLGLSIYQRLGFEEYFVVDAYTYNVKE